MRDWVYLRVVVVVAEVGVEMGAQVPRSVAQRLPDRAVRGAVVMLLSVAAALAILD